MKSKYLNKHGNFRITNLVWETSNTALIYDDNRDLPAFCLKAEDHTDNRGNVFASIPRLFVECGDATGYDFAISVLGSYEHYLELCENKLIGPVIETCKEVIKSKLDSESIKEIKRIATSGGTQVELSAAKYLANREYELKNSVGRPGKKNHIKKDAAQAREESIETKEEMARLGLTH